MTTVALVFGAGHATEGEETHAPLQTRQARLCGQTIIEYQIRALMRAGLWQIIVYAEARDLALDQALQQLRTEGATIDIAQSPAALEALLVSSQRVVMLARAVIADPILLQPVDGRGYEGSTRDYILTVAPKARNQSFEIIDGESHWAGIANLSARFVGQVVGQLDDWDPESTVLRAAVQAGVDRYRVEQDEPNSPLLEKWGAMSAHQSLNQTLKQQKLAAPVGAVERLGFYPMARWSALRCIHWHGAMIFFSGLSLFLVALALASAVLGHFIALLLSFLCIGLSLATLECLALLRGTPVQSILLGQKLACVLGALLFLPMVYGWAKTQGWGVIALGGWLGFEMTMESVTLPWFKQSDEGRNWSPTLYDCAFLLLGAVLFKMPVIGLVAALLYACAHKVIQTIQLKKARPVSVQD